MLTLRFLLLFTLAAATFVSATRALLQDPTPSATPSQQSQVPQSSSPQSSAPAQSTPAPAKREPCPDAKSQLDLNECYANLYLSADTQLNATYNNIVGFMKKNLLIAQHDNNAVLITHNDTSLTKLLAAQRAWLTYRDANCDSVKFQYEGGSIQPMMWSQCMADVTQQRIATLTTAYDIAD
jgi:uncharacterized protein YecT (DUF1311 family)